MVLTLMNNVSAINAAVCRATDKELPAEAKLVSATLFLNGVQLQSEATAALAPGKTLVKIKGISAYADGNSFQVSGQGQFTILSVNYNSSPQKPEDTDEYKKLKKELDDADKNINDERTWISILQKKEEFYNANVHVTGTNQVITVDQLKALGDTYSKTIETIRFSIIERQKKIEGMEDARKELGNKLNLLRAGQSASMGEVWVLVSTASALNARFYVSYFTYNAGWYPSYDLRVNKLSEPMGLTYKANIYQNTGLDWKNIKLRCSNATPYQQGNMPALQPYYLYLGNYYSTPHTGGQYNPAISQVTGLVRDQSTGEALPFVQVHVRGTNYGTTTDVDGKFKLNIPAGSTTLEFSYVGYELYETPVNATYMNVNMRTSRVELQEVTIVAQDIQAMQGVVAGKYEEKSKRGARGGRASAAYQDAGNAYIPGVQTVSAATSIDFEIAEPYSIRSDGAVITVDIQQTDMPAIYEYHATPKLEQAAFLIARVVNWEKYNLLSGEANLYIENTFVGKSTIGVNDIEDTLNISLGRDKNMIVKREKVKDYMQKRFLGSTTTVTRAWKISVKNNKGAACPVYITDQLPFSENKDISVEKIDISGARENTQNGLLEWKLDIQPGETKELNLKYAVKYPKNSVLIVE